MDKGQVWSRYTTEATDVRINNLKERIKEAQKDINSRKSVVCVSPRSITLGDDRATADEADTSTANLNSPV